MEITREKTREIIADFAQELQKKKMEASPAESTRIDFRNGIAENREEIVYKVPIDLLRFRKENGRISSSVKTHERLIGLLDPADSEAQSKLRKFLHDKDPEKTDELKQLLRADGQREPGIVTADGFLINGNRRKVALDELKYEFPADDKFQTMKVVILPGENNEGGPPTLKEIEQIENRYQLQTEGKAEYYGFDAALSIRDKEASGYSLEQQMRDDPQFRLMQETDFKRESTKETQGDVGTPGVRGRLLGSNWQIGRILSDIEGTGRPRRTLASVPRPIRWLLCTCQDGTRSSENGGRREDSRRDHASSVRSNSYARRTQLR